MNGLDRYAPGRIVLHWLTAILIVGAWSVVQARGLFPASLRPAIQQIHIATGLLFTGVLVVRLAVRALGKAPPAEPGLLGRIAGATHLVLYGLMAAIAIAGLVFAWMSGQSLFGLAGYLPAPPVDLVLRRSVREIHELAANAVLVVAGVHAAAALFHHYVLRDGTLRRMLPAD